MQITVNKALYSKEVLLKTAYSLTEKVYLHLDQDDQSWIISWKPKAGQEIHEGEFENELITQALREQLVRQTADVRKMILARAYASTLMDNQQGKETDLASGEEKKIVLDDLNITEEEEKDILRGWFDKP